MSKFYRLSAGFILLILSVQRMAAQCGYYPVSLEQRVSQSAYIVLGKITEQHTYIDQQTGNVNTLNKLEVSAWLKNYSAVENVYVITLGGVYGSIATRVDPALQLGMKQEYILMLEENNTSADDKIFRSQHPDALQLLTYADMQGCFTNFNNSYTSITDRVPENENSILQKIAALTGQAAKKPTGDIYYARPAIVPQSTGRIDAISSFSPNPTNAGTIAPADFLTISGSGFGAIPGDVFFVNADDGGATFMASGVASDIISWSDASITVKVASGAGTGPINVDGIFTSGTNLVINYNHIDINSTFNGFATDTRQRYYHRNLNGLGGYSFLYNTNIFSNSAAVGAFERALSTWRCGTLMNWRSAGTTASGFLADGLNVVLFDATLPPGVLGRATSRFSGSANGACNLSNTVWWLSEIDVQFFPDPPAAGFTWQYGPAAPTGLQYDFESVAVHELGHAHGLGHVIAPAEVMHFAIANGSSKRILSPDDISGGNARMSYSTAPTCFNPGGSGTPMTALTSGECLTLPLVLTAFSGERKSSSMDELYWTTSQEQNTRGFYIQKGGTDSRFTEIGFVGAAGNSTQSVNYSFPDPDAGPYPWYYRLRMVDIDGRETFSPTIFIDGDKTVQWKVWTNDRGDRIYLYSTVTGNNTAVLNLYSMNGQQILTKNVSAGNEEIPVNHLSKGLYNYQLIYNGKITAGKLLLGNK